MLENREGQKVPHAEFRLRVGGDWHTVTTDDVFKGRTVIVFALPGAFTPTCSTTHLPRYDELAPVFKQYGVDDIYCLSVNDAFVMDAWARDQGATYVKMLPDGNGEFTEGMGLLVDKDDLGFGKRSWRYSMLVKDGVIEKQFIEPEEPGDPFKVSDADTMLSHVAPDATSPDKVCVFTREGCGFCVQAKALLDEHGLSYAEVSLPPETRTRVIGAMTGGHTVPQVYINGEYIGGLEALQAKLTSQKAA